MTGIGLGVPQQVRDRLDRQVLVDDQHERHAADQRHRREILDRIVGQRLVHGRTDRHRTAAGHIEQVAVRRGLGAGRGADGRAAAGTVLDHDRLAEPLRQLRLGDTGQRVDRAARRPRHDQRDRPGRIILRRRRLRKCKQRRGGGETTNGNCHECPLRPFDFSRAGPPARPAFYCVPAMPANSTTFFQRTISELMNCCCASGDGLSTGIVPRLIICA